MNSVLIRSNKIIPTFKLNDCSPTSFKRRQKLDEIHSEIQGEQLSEFTRKYRQLVRQESMDYSPKHIIIAPSNNNLTQNQVSNPGISRQTLDLSELNEENRSRYSFDLLSPAKRTSRSLGIIKQQTPQISTSISIRNTSELKSPQQSFYKKIDLSPTQKSSMRVTLLDSQHSMNNSSAIPLIKMQDTFYSKQNKIQNQQFLEKCFGSAKASNKVSEQQYTTPKKAREYIPFNISTTSNDKKCDFTTFSKSVSRHHREELDFITKLNHQRYDSQTSEQINNKTLRANSLNEYLKSSQKQPSLNTSKRRDLSALERKPEIFSGSLISTQNLSDNRNLSQIFVHQEQDFTMNNSKNFNRHLSSLQDLSQSDRKRRKIRGLIDQFIKERQQMDDETPKKHFKLVLNQSETKNSNQPLKEQRNSHRRSSIEMSEQLHYFKNNRKYSIVKELPKDILNNFNTDNITHGTNQYLTHYNENNKLINTTQTNLSQLQVQADLEQKEEVKKNQQIAQKAFHLLHKLIGLDLSHYKIVKLLKGFLAKSSHLLMIILDENKEKLNESLNIKMIEDLLYQSETGIPQKEINVQVQHELMFLISKVEEYILSLEIQKCEIYKQEIIHGCQNLQEMAQNLKKKNKFSYTIQAIKTLDNLSFMGNNMLNKQHSIVEQLGKAQIKYGSLSLINSQNIQKTNSIENQIDKMVKLRQGQIKMLDIFNQKNDAN